MYNYECHLKAHQLKFRGNVHYQNFVMKLSGFWLLWQFCHNHQIHEMNNTTVLGYKSYLAMSISQVHIYRKNFQCKIENGFLLISFNICFRCSKDPSHWDGSFEYPQHMFWMKNKKINIFWYELLTKGQQNSQKMWKFYNSSGLCRPPDKSGYWKTIFFSSHPKHMLWVLKRTVSMRPFFWAPKIHV